MQEVIEEVTEEVEDLEDTDESSEVDDKKYSISIETLFENNFHFGSKIKHRNKAMSEFVFITKKDVDMIDLNKTVVLFEKALQALKKCVSRGGTVLFVGTENNSSAAVKAAAERCAQYHITHRWLGGLLTNWDKTFSPWIASMKKMEKEIEAGYLQGLKKKEQSMILKKHERFMKFYNGVKDMKAVPNMMVVTSNRDRNAIREAEKLNIPVVLLADTTTNPHGIKYIVPGNDASIKAVELFCTYCANACLEGLKSELDRIETRREKINASFASPRDDQQQRRFQPRGPRQDNRPQHHRKPQNDVA